MIAFHLSRCRFKPTGSRIGGVILQPDRRHIGGKRPLRIAEYAVISRNRLFDPRSRTGYRIQNSAGQGQKTVWSPGYWLIRDGYLGLEPAATATFFQLRLP
jgi:hypothetical protein